MSNIQIINSLDQLKSYQEKNINLRIGLVPTMGNLHSGHLSLIEKLKPHVDKVMVSIFINPTQFAPHEDFKTYPRTFDNDLKQLKETFCDSVFYPEITTMYPKNEMSKHEYYLHNHPSIAPLATILCGQTRPHFFEGVIQVIATLFELLKPNMVCFGQKDYQQLRIIEEFTKIVFPHIAIISGPTVREPKGLALSSRNNYLTTKNKEIAHQVYQALLHCKQQLTLCHNKSSWQEVIKKTKDKLENLGFEIDYLQTLNSDSFQDTHRTNNARLFIACYLQSIRLIDSIDLNS